MVNAKKAKGVNFLVVYLASSILISMLLLFGLIYFFLPFHNLNNDLLNNRGSLLGKQEQSILNREQLLERITLSGDDEATSGMSSIMDIVGDNTTNLVVVGATLVLIAILAWLLKKNTEMRMFYGYEDNDIRERAAEALAYATELFNNAKDLVYKSHQFPDDLDIQNEAMAMLQDTDEAIDIATELVMEYKEYREQQELQEQQEYYEEAA